MVTIRRWYVFLVCAVSLQTVTWSVIQLIRNLIRLDDLEMSSLAFPIAVILIGLPLFLVHWLWAQRIAGRDTDERGSALRRLYLFGMLAGFLTPFIANAFGLVENIAELIFGIESSYYVSRTDQIINQIIVILILPMLWAYHWHVLSGDARVVPEMGNSATLRRLYIFGFSATGLVMVSLGVIHLLEWMLFKIWKPAGFINPFDLSGLASEITQLAVGLPLWLIFWQWAQRRFAQEDVEESDSTLRKFYLYVIVFVSVLSVVISGTAILAGFLRNLQGLDPTGDVRQPLSIIIGMAVWWAYHASILRNDARQVQEAPRQAGIRRLYFYLVAAVGLGAFLVGLGGDISVLVRSLDGDFNEDLKGLLAWFTAAIAAGLPVWLLPWRQLQARAVALTPAGAEERQSIVRKIYLYFYLFIATMTVLSGSVYIVTQLLSLLLGARSRGNTSADLGQAVAFTLIGVGVWLYHGNALRTDGAINRKEQTTHLEAFHMVLLDMGEDLFGQNVLEELGREMPGLAPELIRLPYLDSEESVIQEIFSGADMIIAPWTIVMAGRLPPALATALISSPARKLIIPIRSFGWEWAGVDRWNSQALVRQTVRSIQQMILGQEVKAVRPMSVGSIVGISIGVLFLILTGSFVLIQWLVGGF